ncbi:tetratricopeptide repeat protein [Novosphingobium sp.]|uniref:tetratricopeptide repeat protein n=1 Tax=Novosphingobium sp. TaxID=1874826 RepID=UPI0035B0679D
MRSSFKTLMLLAISVPALAACANPFVKANQAAARLLPASGNADLAMGRQALADGQYGTAIAALRFARLDPACSAEATNALGVAYARIGRDDLAERYFREALALAPDDRRFAANLARFGQAQSLRLAAVQAPAPVAAPVQPLKGNVRMVMAGPGRSVVITSAAAPRAIRVANPVPVRTIQVANGKPQLAAVGPVRAAPVAHVTVTGPAPLAIRAAPSAKQLAMARGPLVRRAGGAEADFD